MQIEEARFQNSYELGLEDQSIRNLFWLSRGAGWLYIGLSGCTTGLACYISGCATGLAHLRRLYIGIYARCPVVQRDKLILISCTSGLVQLHIGIAGSLPGCITEYRVSQPDVQLCNRLSDCITAVRLHNQHSWPSVQNIFIICRCCKL